MNQHAHARLRVILACLLLISAVPGGNPLYANQPKNAAPANGNNILAFPPADFYPAYLADPRRAQTAIKLTGIFDSDIDDASRSRFNHALGRRFGLARFGDESAYKAWQIDLDIGYYASFDIKSHLDNIGWDGIYGLYFSRKLSPTRFIRFGTLHDSAHLGDEYIEETGRERIRYTREELIAAMAWLPPFWTSTPSSLVACNASISVLAAFRLARRSALDAGMPSAGLVASIALLMGGYSDHCEMPSCSATLRGRSSAEASMA